MWVIESFVVGVLFTCRRSILLPSRPAGLARCANRRREAPDAAEPLHDREVGRRHRARQIVDAAAANLQNFRSGRSSSAPYCRNGRTHRHRARRLLETTVVPHRQGQGSHRDGPQDRSAVLRPCPSRNGLRRSRRLVLRDTLPYASDQQFAPTAKTFRLCSAAFGTRSWCRFLGIVLQRQLSDPGVQRLHVRGRRRRRHASRSENSGSALLQLRLPCQI